MFIDGTNDSKVYCWGILCDKRDDNIVEYIDQNERRGEWHSFNDEEISRYLRPTFYLALKVLQSVGKVNNASFHRFCLFRWSKDPL
jgi:hypothetical protein